MFEPYRSSPFAPPKFTDVLGSQFDPIVVKASSLASQFSEFTKELGLLSSPLKSPLKSPYLLHLSGDDAEGEKSTLFQQIKEARSEIEELEKKLGEIRARKAGFVDVKQNPVQRQETATDGMEGVLDYLLQVNDITGMGRSANLAASLSAQELESNAQIRSLAVFTKVAFTETSNRLISVNGAAGPIRQYNLAGSACDLPFRLQFNVDETELAVRWLEAKVPSNVRGEMSSFLESVQKENNVQGFFKGFVQYAHLNQQRKNLFRHLCKTYPTMVKADNVEDIDNSQSEEIGKKQRHSDDEFENAGDGVATLRFRDSPSSPELLLVWDLQVHPSSNVEPKVQLLPRFEKIWKSLDKAGVFETLPQQFLRLVEMKGLQTAVEIILLSLYGEQSP